MRCRSWGWVCVASLFASALVHAAPPYGDDPRAAADLDELGIAAWAARVGDAAVLTALQADDALARLAAIRAAPHLHDPIPALGLLAAIAASRDPELAPRAARKLLRIAQDLVRRGLVRREILPETLAPARAALQALAGDGTARADIRLYAGQADHLLGTLGVPVSGSAL